MTSEKVIYSGSHTHCAHTSSCFSKSCHSPLKRRGQMMEEYDGGVYWRGIIFDLNEDEGADRAVANIVEFGNKVFLRRLDILLIIRMY